MIPVALNLTARLALLGDGRTVPITTLFDKFGEETELVGEAVSFTCGEGGYWVSGPISSYTAAHTQ